jgi:hypothetical protein
MVVEMVTFPSARTLVTTEGTGATDGWTEEGAVEGLGFEGFDLGGRHPHGSWVRLFPVVQTFKPHREKIDLHLTESPPSQRGCTSQHLSMFWMNSV